MVIVFEGRDAAGKGGTIKAITERVSPRVFRLVALPAPASAIECEAGSTVPDEDSYLPEEPPSDLGAIETQEEAAQAAAMTGEFYGLFPDQAEAEPPSTNHVPSPGMPRRRSDTAHHEALA